jgi:fumarate reductase subunit C
MTIGQASRVPAWLDLLQGLSGLLLTIFMWAHMLFVSSILLGMDAMYTVARLFEGQYFFGRPYPVLVSVVVAVILFLFSLHAVLSLRKIPANYLEYRRFRRHMGGFRHADTNLWLVQVITGLLLILLTFAHLYQMMLHPSDIGPYASADRVWSGRWWPFYLILLISVEIHGGIGLYRLALKWGWIRTAGGALARQKLQRVKWSVTAFFLILGLLTLAAYMKIGSEHRDNVGERYLPTQGMEK